MISQSFAWLFAYQYQDRLPTHCTELPFIKWLVAIQPFESTHCEILLSYNQLEFAKHSPMKYVVFLIQARQFYKKKQNAKY